MSKFKKTLNWNIKLSLMFILAYIHSTCDISIILPLNIYWEQNALCSHWVELILFFISLDSSKTIFALVPNCYFCLFLSGCFCGTMLSKESSPTEKGVLESLYPLPDILLSWLPTQALPSVLFLSRALCGPQKRRW